MKTTATVYKLVRNHTNGIYLSGLTSLYQPIGSPNVLIYRVGAVTTPLFGKIFAFDSLESARQYVNWHIHDSSRFTLFKAVGTNVVNASPKRIIGYASHTNLKDHWSKKTKDPYRNGQRPAEGTVLCDTLKLVSAVSIN